MYNAFMEKSPDTAEFPLVAYADGLMDALRRHVPAALKNWDEGAIHQARVATRKLKALLDLMGPVTDADRRRPLAKVLRRLRRRLGPLRDADVMLGHLKELGDCGPGRKCAGAIDWLSADLSRRRDALRAEATRGKAPVKVLAKLGAWWPVREQVEEAREAVDLLLAESLHLQLDAFAHQADRLVADARAGKPKKQTDVSPQRIEGETSTAPTDNGQSAPPDGTLPAAPPGFAARQDPHELRIAGKALRYTLEMAAVEGHALPRSLLKTFKRMQAFLGLWHDYVVLTEQSMRASLDAHVPHHDPRLQEELLELSRLTLRRAARQLDGFVKLWADRGPDVAAAVRDSFPLTRPPAEAGAADPGPVPPPDAAATEADPSAPMPGMPGEH